MKIHEAMQKNLPQFRHILLMICILYGTTVQGQPTIYGLGLGSSFDEALELGFELLGSERNGIWHFNRFRTPQGHDLSLTYVKDTCVFIELDQINPADKNTQMPFPLDFGMSMSEAIDRFGFLGHSYEDVVAIKREEGIVHFSCYQFEEYPVPYLCLVYVNDLPLKKQPEEMIKDFKLRAVILTGYGYLVHFYGKVYEASKEYRGLKWEELIRP